MDGKKCGRLYKSLAADSEKTNFTLVSRACEEAGESAGRRAVSVH
jgi:hypothetical protein